MREPRVIRIRLHAALRDAVGTDALLIEVPDDATPDMVFEASIETHPVLADWRSTIAFGTEERLLLGDAPLPEGVEEIHALPPVSGG